MVKATMNIAVAFLSVNTAQSDELMLKSLNVQ